MSSPNIKFQTLIRKFKNGVKESLDKQRIINDFTYQLSSDECLSSGDLIKENNLSSFKYDIKNLSDSPQRAKSKPIYIAAASSSTEDTMLFSFSPNIDSTPEKSNNYTEDNYKSSEYMRDGYLKNVYNAEYCNNDWIIMMYFINRLYTNFATPDKIKIKSLHIHSLPGSNLAAIHHFLYNSKINTKFSNIEWDWLGTINNQIEDPYKLNKDLKRKYAQNVLQIFDTLLASPNNVKYIVNETLSRLNKINFLCIDVENNLRAFVAYAIFIIKLLESNCICYINLPDFSEWDVATINGLILYSLLFQELYLFKFNIDNTLHTVLICKNKKKISIEILYKKLLNLLSSTYLDTHNLFSLEYVKNADITSKILGILKNTINPIVFNDIIYEIIKVLDINVEMFL